MRVALLVAACSTLPVAIVLSGGTGQADSAASEGPSHTAAAASARRLVPLGAGSCAARACHGSHTRSGEADSPVFRSEHTIWIFGDRHARAYRVLKWPESEAIVRNLGSSLPAHRDPRCLACHATPTNGLTREESQSLVAEGVGCEACHGPASGWIDQHLSRGWREKTVSEKRASGMLPTGGTSERVTSCASCHIGAPAGSAAELSSARDVNHDLIAAGHPVLTFELFDRVARMPHHWPRRGGAGRRDSARAWVIAQLVAAKAALELSAGRAEASARGGAPWPEFSELDCRSCHHTLHAQLPREPASGPGRSPSFPPWDTWYDRLTEVWSDEARGDPRAIRDEALAATLRALERPDPDAGRHAAASRRAVERLGQRLHALEDAGSLRATSSGGGRGRTNLDPDTVDLRVVEEFRRILAAPVAPISDENAPPK